MNKVANEQRRTYGLLLVLGLVIETFTNVF